jgi:hypothetical protein
MEMKKVSRYFESVWLVILVLVLVVATAWQEISADGKKLVVLFSTMLTVAASFILWGVAVSLWWLLPTVLILWVVVLMAVFYTEDPLQVDPYE